MMTLLIASITPSKDGSEVADGGQAACRYSLVSPLQRVEGDVIDLDTALGEQLLNVAVRQPVAQVPAPRQQGHLRRDR